MFTTTHGTATVTVLRFVCDDIALFDPIDHRQPLFPGITAAPVDTTLPQPGTPQTGGMSEAFAEGALPARR